MTHANWVETAAGFLREHKACGQSVERTINGWTVAYRCPTCGHELSVTADRESVTKGFERLAELLESQARTDATLDDLLDPIRSPNASADDPHVQRAFAYLVSIFTNEAQDEWRRRRRDSMT